MPPAKSEHLVPGLSPASRVFALTGGIGSGKSSVARVFEEAGVFVVDADQLARQVVAPGSVALQEIVSAFGTEMIQADGTLDRARLGRVVFQDEKSRAALNAIVHPRVKTAAQEAFEGAKKAGETLICYEVPLLFETKQEDTYRPVVVVSCPLSLRVSRVCARDGISEEEALSRIHAQTPEIEKIARADYVIENDGSLSLLKQRALFVLEEVRALS